MTRECRAVVLRRRPGPVPAIDRGFRPQRHDGLPTRTLQVWETRSVQSMGQCATVVMSIEQHIHNFHK